MVIGIDIRCLLEKSWSGISWHTFHSLQALLRIDTKNEYIFFYNQRKKSDIQEKFKEFSNISWKIYRYPNWAFHFFIILFHWPKIDQLMKGCDIIWFPNLHFISIKNCPYIVTCHDLSFVFFKDCFSLKMRFWHQLIKIRKLFTQSSHIICVSEHTKKDLNYIFHLPLKKMSVISPCVTDQSLPSSMLKLPASYLLTVSTIEPRKNIESIIRFFEQIEENIHLVIVGKKGWKSQKIFKALQNSPKKDYILYLGYLSEEQKSFVYRHAKGFIYPSYYEGYGIPPKEAVYYNIPVMSSWTSSLSENLGNGVAYIDPYHIEDMHIVYDQWRKNIPSLRIKRKKQDYKKVASLLLEIFEHVAKNYHRA